jgi:NRPS condensation-like uncharacterized protein
LDPDALRGALNALIEHHDALRLRFTQEDGVWRQLNAPVGEPASLAMFDVSAFPPAEQLAIIKDNSAQLQASLNLSTGPTLRAAYFNLGAEQKGRLLVIIHHLCVDGVSWRVLLEDLRLAYEQLQRREEVKLPAKTTSFKRWAEQLQQYAQSDELKAEADYWLENDSPRYLTLPVDHAAGANTLHYSNT